MIAGNERQAAIGPSKLDLFRFPRIPTQIPFQAVFMRGGAGPACMDDLVVVHGTADGESNAPLDSLWRHARWTPFGCLISCKIMSIISVICDFTTVNVQGSHSPKMDHSPPYAH